LGFEDLDLCFEFNYFCVFGISILTEAGFADGGKYGVEDGADCPGKFNMFVLRNTLIISHPKIVNPTAATTGNI